MVHCVVFISISLPADTRTGYWERVHYYLCSVVTVPGSCSSVGGGYVQIWTFYAKVVESYRLTEKQTRPELYASRVVQKFVALCGHSSHRPKAVTGDGGGSVVTNHHSGGGISVTVTRLMVIYCVSLTVLLAIYIAIMTHGSTEVGVTVMSAHSHNNGLFVLAAKKLD